MGSAFHQLCPRYSGTLTPTAPTAIRLWDTFTFTFIIYNKANSDDAHVLFPFSRTYLDRVSFEGNNINQQKGKRRNIHLELYFKKINKRNAGATRSSISFRDLLTEHFQSKSFNKLPFLTITKSSRTCNKRM